MNNFLKNHLVAINYGCLVVELRLMYIYSAFLFQVFFFGKKKKELLVSSCIFGIYA